MDEEQFSPRDEAALDEQVQPQPDGGGGGSSRLILILAVIAVLLGLLLVWWVWWPSEEPGPTPSATRQQPAAQPGDAPEGLAAPAPSAHGDVVDVKPAPGSPEAQEQDARKKPYGLDKSVDAVVRSDESIKLGDRQVPVKELERKLVVNQRGEVLERPLGEGEKVTTWAVREVRPGDNLWDIHYRLLEEYLADRGVTLRRAADEPTGQGRSSGVGKVLKFAEHMVGIYNLHTGQMTRNINLLEPGRKVVVFNLSEIFGQLAEVDPGQLEGISFDGRVLLFPERMAAQPPSAEGSR